MIRLGLRLTISGGREAVLRLVILVTAVGLGTGLLLAAISGINAVSTQNDRHAWLWTGTSIEARPREAQRGSAVVAHQR